MKKVLILTISLSLLTFLPISWAEPSGNGKASKDSKTIEELNYKYDRLIQLDYARHQEVMRQLREIRELAKKFSVPRADLPVTPSATMTEAVVTPPVIIEPITPSATAPLVDATIKIEPAAPESEKPVVEAIPAPTMAPVVAPAHDAVPEVGPMAVIPAPVTTPSSAQISTPGADREALGRGASNALVPPPPTEIKPVKAVIPPEVLQGIHESESFAILAILFSVVSLASMGVLIYTVRKSDARLRRMVWKSEVDHLRNEVMGGRPLLKVEKSYDRLLLTNTGTVAADDIKLSLGPAPATMKQRLRVLAKIAAGEKAEVEIGAQADGQVHGTLEYKNPESERTYKEQFTLKVDSVTGELTPIQNVG